MSHVCIKAGKLPKRNLFLDLVVVKVRLTLRVVKVRRSPSLEDTGPSPGMTVELETSSRHQRFYFVYLRVSLRLSPKMRNCSPNTRDSSTERAPLLI